MLNVVRCRLSNPDGIASHSPGCARAASEKYAAALSRQWMEAEPEAIGTLYVDGHVRVYHGSKTKLPRKYVSRQRLCLRGTTDYWVSDKHGRPFFVIDKVVDRGLLAALREDIVPRLLREVPKQPTPEQLLADPLLRRFTLVFDREGYSPAFFKMMWNEHRIACITYHKHPTEPWDVAEFCQREFPLSNGEKVTMPPGRARFPGGQRCRCHLDEGGALTHRRRPPGQPRWHRLPVGTSRTGGGPFQPMVSRELLPLFDATLCN